MAIILFTIFSVKKKQKRRNSSENPAPLQNIKNHLSGETFKSEKHPSVFEKTQWNEAERIGVVTNATFLHYDIRAAGIPLHISHTVFV